MADLYQVDSGPHIEFNFSSFSVYGFLIKSGFAKSEAAATNIQYGLVATSLMLIVVVFFFFPPSRLAVLQQTVSDDELLRINNTMHPQ